MNFQFIVQIQSNRPMLLQSLNVSHTLSEHWYRCGIRESWPDCEGTHQVNKAVVAHVHPACKQWSRSCSLVANQFVQFIVHWETECVQWTAIFKCSHAQHWGWGVWYVWWQWAQVSTWSALSYYLVELVCVWMNFLLATVHHRQHRMALILSNTPLSATTSRLSCLSSPTTNVPFWPAYLVCWHPQRTVSILSSLLCMWGRMVLKGLDLHASP